MAHLVADGLLSKITKEEIEDKSKGDIVTKGLVVIHTGWFIMQCIARGAKDLAVTELEIMTVAFAFLNFITYLFWWNKPLNVNCPIRIVVKEGHRVPEPRPPETLSITDQILEVLTLIIPSRDDDVDLLRLKSVPTFYAGKIEEDSKAFYVLMSAEMTIAVICMGGELLSQA